MQQAEKKFRFIFIYLIEHIFMLYLYIYVIFNLYYMWCYVFGYSHATAISCTVKTKGFLLQKGVLTQKLAWISTMTNNTAGSSSLLNYN